MAPAPRVSVHRRVDALPEAVWAVVTDIPRAPERLSSILAVEMLTEGGYAVGTRWRETRRELGRTEVHEMHVVEVDPSRRTVVEARDGGTAFRTLIELEPVPGGTQTDVTLTFSADLTDPTRLQRLALTVMGPLGVRLTERALRTELTDIAAAAEALPGP